MKTSAERPHKKPIAKSPARATDAVGPNPASAGQDAVWTQRVGGLCTIPALLKPFGVDVAAVLAEAGLAPDALDSPDNRVSFPAAARLVVESTRQTGCAHFGLLIGQAWHLAHMGILGDLIRHQPTVGDALKSFVVHQRLYSQGAAPYLYEYPATVHFGVVVFHPLAHGLAPVHDLILAVLVTCMRELCGERWHPTEVELPRARPADDTPYREHFRCRLRFDAERATVHFPQHVLQRTLRGADPARRRAAEHDASRLLDEQLLPLLYRSLRLLLQEGDPTMPSLAAQLGLHARTLDRRLRRRGTTFQAILDDVRFEAARQLLRDTRRPVREIAPALGYGEESAFARAFRRWSGKSPIEWRSLNAGHSG